MTSKQWQKVKEILDDIGSQATGPKDLAERCGGDEELLRDVESFLAVAEDAEELLDEPLWSFHNTPEVDEAPSKEPDAGRRIGPYRIERLLGRGGMGAVYLALREDEFQQRVALKLVNRHLADGHVLDRFYNERQLLAHLEHPHIARLLDGGADDEGQPYFVMEYVEGEPIDDYCERHALSIRQRLELFRKVCAAVHVAHQNLVVHRDLKPSNILVTPAGEPKLLDFGIAKVLEPESVPHHTVRTAPGHAPMTPEYASPEQVMNNPLTTSSDVYALGVLLYRLLTGRSPYPNLGRSYFDLVQSICLTMPQRPSTVVTPHSKTGTARPAAAEVAKEPTLDQRERRRLRRRLSGDLDAIVMKALRKEPEKRYGSVVELAEDVRRHLVGLPVVARKGSRLYDAGKFVKRHKIGVAMVLGVVILFGALIWLYRRIEMERNRADNVADFLEEIFEASDPNLPVTAKSLLERGSQKIDDFATDDRSRSRLLGVMGEAYRKLGSYQKSQELLEKAIDLDQDLGSSQELELALHLNDLGNALSSQSKYEEAKENLREALRIRTDHLGENHEYVARTLQNLASALKGLDKYSEAKDAYEKALAISQSALPPNDPQIGSILNNLGNLLLYRRNFVSAEHLLQKALDIQRQAYGKDHTFVADVLSNLGKTMTKLERYDEAEKHYLDALEINTELLGDDNLKVAYGKSALAGLYAKTGRAEEGESLVREALVTLRRELTPENWGIAVAESNLGACLLRTGQFEEAKKLLLSSLETLEEKGDDNLFTRETLEWLVTLYEEWGRPQEADPYRQRLNVTGSSDHQPETASTTKE